jgi:hypothetical protein
MLNQFVVAPGSSTPKASFSAERAMVIIYKKYITNLGVSAVFK